MCTLSCYKVLISGLRKDEVINLYFLLFKIIFLKLIMSQKSKFLEKGVRLITNNQDTVNREPTVI